ncbi:phospholipase SGR2-like isoform X2 [Tripterygium wilfordii]|uniref:phospholipase SGR2-like isoform X2 n=1 Tax=Tripterygium wilfordii TaxID=458696 RepID=UPI0018F7FDF3|nr:phospholipase SGR2-like isoform X2 [Tripterygium wilfordii]
MADSEANYAVSEGTRVEETTPALLKNTPSNIARLEDVIEQSKGRQKYLAQTRSSSDGGDVRWYFCKVPLTENELAASVPRTEMVGKGDYFRFGMRDSLAIEASFLQREEGLLTSWWKEYAECSEGPMGRPSTSKKKDAQMYEICPGGNQSTQLYEVEEERVGVPVKGGLYEVDLVKRHCFPVYWNGENRRVLRGHWFACKGGLDWLPLREDIAEQLEMAYRSQVWHRRTFQPSGLFAARVDLQASTPGLHALFTGEDNTWEAWLNVDASGFSGVISFTRNGIRLRRGFSESHSPKPTQDELRQQKEEEMDDDCSQVPVRHLVFMVHGIGQRLEKSNLVDDVGNLCHIIASLAEQHLTSHQRSTQRVLFIPCQWRKGLMLSGEAAVEKCTLDGVRGLRATLSATVHDVLYYMSPIYRQDIINSASNQLNRLYLKFLRRNPGYNGKVSLYGHSLGSVLSYDIICHQEKLCSPFPMDWMYNEHARSGEPSSDMNDQSTTCHSLTNMDDKSSSRPKATQDMVDPVDKESLSPPSTLLDEDGLKSIGEVTTGHSNGPVIGLKEASEEECKDTCNKEETIKLLKEEVDSLKARIAELKSKCSRSDVLLKENEGALTTMEKQPISEMPPPGLDKSKSYTPYIKYTKLEFKVDTFFAVGSPLGVFLALRNIRIGIGKGQAYWEEENISEEIPACRQMFNIFHPFDPVAYRIEPLVCKEYITKRPVIVPYHKGGKRLHIGFQEFSEDLAARSQAIMNHLNSVRVKVLTVCQSRDADIPEEGAEDAEEKLERSYGEMMMEMLTGSAGRIDHMLQDKTFEHSYLQALGSHTNYWRDNDTALFILKHLYSDIPEDPSSPNESNGCNSKEETGGSTAVTDQRDVVDEELPLTFSDRQMVENLSRRVKKVIKRT